MHAATEHTRLPRRRYRRRPSTPTAARACAQPAAERGLDGVLVVSRGANGADWGGDVVYLTNHYSAFPQIPDRPGQLVRAAATPGSSCPCPRTARSSSRSPTGARTSSRSTTCGSRSTCGPASPRRCERAGSRDGHVGLIGRESLLHIAVDRIREAHPDLRFAWADDLIEELRRDQVAGGDRARARGDARRLRDGRVVRGGGGPGRHRGRLRPRRARRAASPRAPSRSTSRSSPARHVDHFLWERMPSWDRVRPLEPGRHDPPRHVRHRQRLLLRHGPHDRGRAAPSATPSARSWRRRSPWSSTSSRRCGPGVACGELFDRGADVARPSTGFDAPAPSSQPGRGDARSEPTRRSATASGWPGRTRRSSRARRRCSSRAW